MQKPHPGSLCKWEAWWKLSLQRYAYFLKLQNFLRINFCKIPCFERRLHIVSENLARLTINFFRRFSVTTSWVYNWFSCSAFRQLHFQRHWCLRQAECNRPFVGCFSVVIRIVFAAKTLFCLKNLLINSLFSFIFCTFVQCIRNKCVCRHNKGRQQRFVHWQF